jgi:hypothetical protein
MTDQTTHLALFDTLDPAADAVATLRELGVPDEDISIISGAPYHEPMLGRPHVRSFVPLFGIGGALGGFVIGIALNWGTPLLYPVHAGGKPLFPVPPTAVLTFETTMLGLLIFTFLGVIWESAFPAFGKKEYHPAVSDGGIALYFKCLPNQKDKIYAALTQLGAASLAPAEVMKL